MQWVSVQDRDTFVLILNANPLEFSFGLPDRPGLGTLAAQHSSTTITMLTISAFLLTTGSVLTSVWWACKAEPIAPDSTGADA